MSVNSSLSLSQEINKSYDSSNLNFSFNEKEEKEGDYSFFYHKKLIKAMIHPISILVLMKKKKRKEIILFAPKKKRE